MIVWRFSLHIALFLVGREQEAVKVVLVLPSVLVGRERDRSVYIENRGLADLGRSAVLGHIADAVDGLLLAGVAIGLIVGLLKLLDVRDEFGFAHWFDQ